MAAPFATPADLASFLPADGSVTVPEQAEAVRLLARAEELVVEAATTGWAVDTAGDPTDTTIAGALRDACCAQVEQWLEVGEENDIAGYSRATSLSVGGVSVSSLPSVLGPRARRILRSAGLTSAVSW